jgi:rootletin
LLLLNRSCSPVQQIVTTTTTTSNTTSNIDVADVDPEAIRCALREFVQNLANTERDRDDALSEANQLKRNIGEVMESHARTEQRLGQLQKLMTESEEDKRGIDTRLASAQTALMLQEETIRRNERERKASTDKQNALERQLLAADSDKAQMSERLAKLKQSELRSSDDKKSLKKHLEEAEMRATECEMSRRAFEGEIQRLSIILSDKEAETLAQLERVDCLVKQVQERDDKCQCLQLSIDRLSLSLAKT